MKKTLIFTFCVLSVTQLYAMDVSKQLVLNFKDGKIALDEGTYSDLTKIVSVKIKEKLESGDALDLTKEEFEFFSSEVHELSTNLARMDIQERLNRTFLYITKRRVTSLLEDENFEDYGRLVVVAHSLGQFSLLDFALKLANKSLIEWAQENNLAAVKALLELQKSHPNISFIDVNFQERSRKNTALMIAFSKKHYEMVELLLDAGADPNIQNKEGRTALTFNGGVGDPSVEAVKLLLRHTANVNIPTNCWGAEKTALIYTTLFSDNLSLIELLLDAGAEVDYQDLYGNTALMYAASNGAQDRVELLLERGASVEITNNDGQTALMQAASSRRAQSANPKIIPLLSKRAEDIQTKAHHDDPTPWKDYTPKPIDQHDRDGNTALMLAVKCNNRETVQLLIKMNAKIDAKNCAGETALMLAAQEGYEDIARLLLEAGAQVTIEDGEGRTPLIFTAFNRATLHTYFGENKLSVLTLLLGAGANIDHQDDAGNTTLIEASRNVWRDKEVKYLLTQKASNLKNKMGETALDGAASDEIKVLLQKISA